MAYTELELQGHSSTLDISVRKWGPRSRNYRATFRLPRLGELRAGCECRNFHPRVNCKRAPPSPGRCKDEEEKERNESRSHSQRIEKVLETKLFEGAMTKGHKQRTRIGWDGAKTPKKYSQKGLSLLLCPRCSNSACAHKNTTLVPSPGAAQSALRRLRGPWETRFGLRNQGR